jgi:hypothetical protein
MIGPSSSGSVPGAEAVPAAGVPSGDDEVVAELGVANDGQA